MADQSARVRADAELHVHLRGAMPRALFSRLCRRIAPGRAIAEAPQRYRELFERQPHLRRLIAGRAEPESLFEFSDFEGFLASYLFSLYFIRSVEDFLELALAVRAEFERQGLGYVEATVSLPEYLMQGLPLEGLVEALDEASSRPGLRLRWIVDLVRNFGPEAAENLLERLLRRRPRHWVGITLGGSEHSFPPGPFRRCYERARAEGLGLTVHAGEAAGPESVWEAIRELGVERIGHGVRAVEDPGLVRYLAERAIPLEVCPTSNVRTGVYAGYAEHPLPLLHRAGVPTTINSDDPTFFGSDLAGEFRRASEMGLSDDELAEIAANGRRFAFDRQAFEANGPGG